MYYKTAPLKRTTHIGSCSRTVKQYLQGTKRILHYRASLAQPGHAAQSIWHCPSLRGTFHSCDTLVRSNQGGTLPQQPCIDCEDLWVFSRMLPNSPCFPVLPAARGQVERWSQEWSRTHTDLGQLLHSIRGRLCGRCPASRTSSTLQRH